jgi:hypothetical protein
MPNKYERNNPYFLRTPIVIKKTKEFELTIPKNAQFRFKKKFIKDSNLMYLFETPEKTFNLVVDDSNSDSVLTDILTEE